MGKKTKPVRPGPIHVQRCLGSDIPFVFQSEIFKWEGFEHVACKNKVAWSTFEIEIKIFKDEEIDGKTWEGFVELGAYCPACHQIIFAQWFPESARPRFETVGKPIEPEAATVIPGPEECKPCVNDPWCAKMPVDDPCTTKETITRPKTRLHVSIEKEHGVIPALEPNGGTCPKCGINTWEIAKDGRAHCRSPGCGYVEDGLDHYPPEGTGVNLKGEPVAARDARNTAGYAWTKPSPKPGSATSKAGYAHLVHEEKIVAPVVTETKIVAVKPVASRVKRERAKRDPEAPPRRKPRTPVMAAVADVLAEVVKPAVKPATKEKWIPPSRAELVGEPIVAPALPAEKPAATVSEIVAPIVRKRRDWLNPGSLDSFMPKK